MLSNENVCFLPWHILFHEQRGRASYNKTDLGQNDLMHSRLGCFPSHLGVRTGSACGGLWQEVLCMSWEGRIDPHGQDITLLPLPDCVSQSSHGHCSASCWGKPWLLSIHLPRPANWRQRSVRCCRESRASSLRTDRPLLSSIQDLRPLRPRWSHSLWGGRTGNCHLDKSCPGPKQHRRVTCGDSEGSWLKTRQDDVMRWHL